MNDKQIVFLCDEKNEKRILMIENFLKNVVVVLKLNIRIYIYIYKKFQICDNSKE